MGIAYTRYRPYALIHVHFPSYMLPMNCVGHKLAPDAELTN